jgi:antitoxin PrlF
MDQVLTGLRGRVSCRKEVKGKGSKMRAVKRKAAGEVKTARVVIRKLSSKGQVTVPKAVRDALGIHSGDAIAYEIDGDVIRLRRCEPFDAAFHAALSATLDEWATKEDEEAFRDL